MPETPVDIEDFFATLVEAQSVFKSLNDQQPEIMHHLGNGAMVVQGAMAARNVPQARRSMFNKAVARLQARIMKQTDAVLKPLRMEAMNLRLTNLHYVSLKLDPSLPVRRNHEALKAFTQSAAGALAQMQQIRKRSEKNLYRSGGLDRMRSQPLRAQMK